MFANLGLTLILLRELLGKSQAQVARAARVGKSQLSKYENGKELPKLESLERVLSALGIGPLELFSTLEMVDRRAAGLEKKPEDPLDWLSLGTGFQSGVLAESTTAGFNQVIADLLALHRLVVGETVRRVHRKGEV